MNDGKTCVLPSFNGYLPNCRPGAFSYCTYCGTLLRYFVSAGLACAPEYVVRKTMDRTSIRK